MKKLLFLIHDLGQGGAEKVLVNLVNNLDPERFDVTVMTLFDCGENRAFLAPHIRYRSWIGRMIPGNSYLMKLFSPKMLHKLIVREHYDVEIAYLEGPCARVISGCPDPTVKKIAWIHIQLDTEERASGSFRSPAEARACYAKFDRIVSVSREVERIFRRSLGVPGDYRVLYNTNQTADILARSQESVSEPVFPPDAIKLVGVGKLLKNKGFDRVLPMAAKLCGQGHDLRLYLLGDGPMRGELETLARELGIADRVCFLGYQTNPYKYVAKCDLFFCASHAEGFSTAATEALILGVPVCTVEVSGMKEMLGEDNAYGIVTENTDEALYDGLKRLVEDPALLAHYRQQAKLRGKDFSTEQTVRAVEELLEDV